MFKEEIITGLQKKEKCLPSKYFYDAKGDALFVEIMNMPEYYLTNSEMEIFKEQSLSIIEAFAMENKSFDLVELGAGDGSKTIHLLKDLIGKYDYTYKPIDISQNALNNLEAKLREELPDLKSKGLQGDYFHVLSHLKEGKRPKIILFLGSNIGNLEDEEAKDLLHGVSEAMLKGDKLLVGADLKKDPKVILDAYNDQAGITSAFNLNLLHRINRELSANFDLDKFEHAPVYDEVQGMARSYIKSLANQEVDIDGEIIQFGKGELIHTEISRKYDHPTMQKIINGSQLTIKQEFIDSRNYFTDFLLEKGSGNE